MPARPLRRCYDPAAVPSRRPPSALSIAASDPSGGAGVQADLKTFGALEVYGAAAITALTVQNTTGVHAVQPVRPGLVAAQIEAVLSDLSTDAVKIGLVGQAEVADAVAGALARHAHGPVVLDPVLCASDGTTLLDERGLAALCEALLPRTDVLTPNLPEAAILLERTPDELLAAPREACRELVRLGPRSVLLKGGHAGGDVSEDLFFDGEDFLRLAAPRIRSRNTHGTGCVLSSALAAFLARGVPLREAARAAKGTVTAALAAAVDWELGAGNGPVQPFGVSWCSQSDELESRAPQGELERPDPPGPARGDSLR